MKTFLKTGFVIGSLLLAACAAKKPTADEILKDDKLRDEVMTAICNDSNMTEQMINHMSTTGASAKMLPFTCQMMGKILSNPVMQRDTAIQNSVMSGMLQMIAKDSQLCDKTCTQMNNTPSIQHIMAKKSNRE